TSRPIPRCARPSPDRAPRARRRRTTVDRASPARPRDRPRRRNPMATISLAEPRTFSGERRHLFAAVGRDGYEILDDLVGERSAPRLTFDARRGDVELMSPGLDHESFAEQLAYLVVAVAEELGLDCWNLAAMTWKGPAGGLQADKCFYLTNFARVWGKKA